ncbi:MAG: lipase maturation factor family protein [Proteobacteria bacterium]|nr:lipase maturation factor family protein [Pseudomonadota bacterium]
MNNQKPAMLLYDGKCDICREWVDYWQQLTGDKVNYRPYQEATGDYPDIAVEDLDAAIHLIESDGTIYKGARATYSLYRDIHPQSILLLFYRFLPGFAFFSELFYQFFSTHRGVLAFFTHLFWGRNFEPPRYQIITWLFLRLLGLTYLVAFISFAVQASALIGGDGVLPVEYYLNAVKEQLGTDAYARLPTLFWFSHVDGFIKFVCIAGIVLSLSLITGFLLRTCLVMLYVLYLSLVHGGQVFMSFQWDFLLLECGFLAIFLPWGSTIIVWLYRWLVFRFMFLGGVVKIVSGDKSWDSLTALSYHFETQPLATPLSWYVHHLPESVLMAGTGMTLIIELLVPFLIFTPRRFRHIAAWCFLIIETCILLTGNYNFFNLLTIFMILFLFDDAAIKHLMPYRILAMISDRKYPTVGMVASSCALLMAITSIYMGSTQIKWVMSRHKDSQFSAVYRVLDPFGIVNSYGPFAVMTRVRNEIVIEGSADESTWQEYQFKYKPGNLEKCPTWVAPHQPRIDWQMWFAALNKPEHERWLFNLLIRLLQHSEPVTAIFKYNPFPDDPPASVRARFYEYTFTSAEERKKTGQCWNRSLVGEYYPPISIKKSFESIN